MASLQPAQLLRLRLASTTGRTGRGRTNELLDFLPFLRPQAGPFPLRHFPPFSAPADHSAASSRYRTNLSRPAPGAAAEAVARKKTSLAAEPRRETPSSTTIGPPARKAWKAPSLTPRTTS